MKYCARCGALVPYPRRLCERCESKSGGDTGSGRHDKRSKAFYNSKEWKLLARKKLSDANYTCEKCGGIATDVHHVVPIRQDWSRRLDYDNLQALCDSCHKRERKK